MNVGDRVKVISGDGYDLREQFIGQEGVIRKVYNRPFPYDVEFDSHAFEFLSQERGGGFLWKEHMLEAI